MVGRSREGEGREVRKERLELRGCLDSLRSGVTCQGNEAQCFELWSFTNTSFHSV